MRGGYRSSELVISRDVYRYSTDFLTLGYVTPNSPTANASYLRKFKLSINVSTFWVIQAIFEFWTLSQDIAKNRFSRYSSETKVCFQDLILKKEFQTSI